MSNQIDVSIIKPTVEKWIDLTQKINNVKKQQKIVADEKKKLEAEIAVWMKDLGISGLKLPTGEKIEIYTSTPSPKNTIKKKELEEILKDRLEREELEEIMNNAFGVDEEAYMNAVEKLKVVRAAGRQNS